MHPYKSLFWIEQNALILSDIHFGKASHFRKAGIPIPHSVHLHDLNRLKFLVDHYTPSNIILLGDVFHSAHNKECELLKVLLESIPANKVMVKGNHDIIDERYYDFVDLFTTRYMMGPFGFQHHPPEEVGDDDYIFAGHIHPSVSVRTSSKSRIRLSCFLFRKKLAILPAFGNFTGNSKISYNFDDQIFGITEDEIFKIEHTALAK